MSCSRTQRSDAGEARTRGPSVSSQALQPLSPPAKYVDEDVYPVYAEWNFGLNIFISLIQVDMQDIYTYNSNL